MKLGFFFAFSLITPIWHIAIWEKKANNSLQIIVILFIISDNPFSSQRQVFIAVQSRLPVYRRRQHQSSDVIL